LMTAHSVKSIASWLPFECTQAFQHNGSYLHSYPHFVITPAQ
jgi:hypothetical protein